MDDHAFIRRGIKGLLSDVTDWTVLGEAENGHDAIKLTAELQPDMILLDVSMPGLSGLDVVRTIREKDRKTKILLLTLHDSHELIRNAFHLGVNGYLLKTDAENELVKAMRVILGDGIYLSPKLDQHFVQTLVANITDSPPPSR